MWEEVLVLRSVQYVRRKQCCLRHIMKNSIGQYCFKCSTFLFVITKKHHYVKKFNIYCKTCSLRKKLINWSFPRLIIDENNNTNPKSMYDYFIFGAICLDALIVGLYLSVIQRLLIKNLGGTIDY